ncbi:hypothetical protein CGRA01v4_10274 [Colletotrichum graminicola]|nr:hypothetical protein CGRA01v4_10274 [Colletotrichum graminicola]
MSFLFLPPPPSLFNSRTTRTSSPGHVRFCLSVEMVSEGWERVFCHGVVFKAATLTHRGRDMCSCASI